MSESAVPTPADLMAAAFRLVLSPGDQNPRNVPLNCHLTTHANGQPVAFLHFPAHETLRDRIAEALLRADSPGSTLTDAHPDAAVQYRIKADAVLKVLA
ncbi:MAG TPA: hypothetical protein VGD46_15540 [Rhizobacter sp.]